MKNMVRLQKTFVSAIIIAGLFLFSACKKEVNNPKNTNTQTNNSPVYYMSGTLGGEAVSLSSTQLPYNDSTAGITPPPGETGRIWVTGAKFVTANASNTATVTMGSIDLRRLLVKIFLSPIAEVNTYFNMLNSGTYGFVYANGSTNGAYITVVDKNGTLWTSEGDQTGSTFQITTQGDILNNTSTITGTFSVKMYDINGNMQKLTNGKFNVTALL